MITCAAEQIHEEKRRGHGELIWAVEKRQKGVIEGGGCPERRVRPGSKKKKLVRG